MLQGIGVSSGIGVAKALICRMPVPADYVPHKSASPETELRRFEAAREVLLNRTDELRQKTARHFGDEEALIFDAYRMMLEDEDSLVGPILNRITNLHYSAVYAVSTRFEELAQMFLSMKNEYMRQRSDDAYDLRDQFLREMMGIATTDSSHLDRPTIVVAHALSPSDIASFDLSRLEGIICENGGYSTHTAIIARTLGVPAIMGVAKATQYINNDSLVALDGQAGEIWVGPDEEEIFELHRRAEAIAEKRAKAQSFRGLPTITVDGHRTELSANVGLLSEVDTALEADAESIGMFRTELLPSRHKMPATEEEQFDAYRAILDKMNGKAVTVRTFDDAGNNLWGAHKPYKETNPVLGYRGIRMSLGRPSCFRNQLRALLRASAYGSLKIMLPMVSTPQELTSALKALDCIKGELRRENIPFDEKLPVGVIIEVPAAALLSEIFAQQVDFFSISINDLIQFTLAVDRGNPDLTYLYHQYHPAVLRLIKGTVKAAHKYGIPCNLCGEAPGEEQALPLLLGLGLDGFSMNPGLILQARQILNSCSYAECQKLADEALTMNSTSEVAKQLSSLYYG